MKKSALVICILLALLTVGCGASNTSKNEKDQTTSALPTETQAARPKLYLDFSVDGRAADNEKVNVSLDGQVIDSIADSNYYTKLIEVEKGTHIVDFSIDGTKTDDNNQSLEINEDTCLKGSIVFQDDKISVNNIDITNSIADSAIKYSDLSGVALDEALSQLSSKHFVNVMFDPQNEGETIVDPADWQVEAQNVKDGAVLDKADPIVLTCKKVYFQLYLDLGFDSNLFLARYNLDVYLDNSKLDTIPHGESYTKLNRVKVGEHNIEFRNASNDSIKATKSVTISGDSTFKAQLHTNDKNIEINNAEIIASIEGASLEVPNVVGMVLDAAMNTMSSSGFSNVREEPHGDIWSRANWTVISQSIEGGKTADKNERIVLDCVKTTEYLSNSYVNLSIADAESTASKIGSSLKYTDFITSADISNSVASMSPSEKKLWIVKQVKTAADATNLVVVYAGNVEMPNLLGRNLETALKEMASLKFSAVEAKGVNGDAIWSNSGWFVQDQSINPGSLVNANGLISLSCVKAGEYLSKTYVDRSIADARITAEKNKNVVSYYDKLTYEDYSAKVSEMKQEEAESWKVVEANSHGNNIDLMVVYSGSVEMPNLVGKTLDQAYEEMYSLKFSAVEANAEDNSTIRNNAEWVVVAQSIEAGKKVNANGLISLTASKIDQQNQGSAKYDIDKDLTVVMCEKDSKRTTMYNIVFAETDSKGEFSEFYTFDTCVNPRDMGKEFNAIGPLPNWFYVGAVVHVKANKIGNGLSTYKCEVTPVKATTGKAEESEPVSVVTESGPLGKLKGKEIFEQLLKGENVSHKDDYGDSEWYSYVADVNKMSVEVNSLGKNGKVISISVMDLLNTDQTEMYYKALNCVFSGSDLEEATAWLKKNLGKEASTKINDANIVLSLSVSKRPIMYIIDDEHLDWI